MAAAVGTVVLDDEGMDPVAQQILNGILKSGCFSQRSSAVPRSKSLKAGGVANQVACKAAPVGAGPTRAHSMGSRRPRGPRAPSRGRPRDGRRRHNEGRCPSQTACPSTVEVEAKESEAVIAVEEVTDTVTPLEEANAEIVDPPGVVQEEAQDQAFDGFAELVNWHEEDDDPTGFIVDLLNDAVEYYSDTATRQDEAYLVQWEHDVTPIAEEDEAALVVDDDEDLVSVVSTGDFETNYEDNTSAECLAHCIMAGAEALAFPRDRVTVDTVPEAVLAAGRASPCLPGKLRRRLAPRQLPPGEEPFPCDCLPLSEPVAREMAPAAEIETYFAHADPQKARLAQPMAPFFAATPVRRELSDEASCLLRRSAADAFAALFEAARAEASAIIQRGWRSCPRRKKVMLSPSPPSFVAAHTSPRRNLRLRTTTTTTEHVTIPDESTSVLAATVAAPAPPSSAAPNVRNPRRFQTSSSTRPEAAKGDGVSNTDGPSGGAVPKETDASQVKAAARTHSRGGRPVVRPPTKDHAAVDCQLPCAPTTPRLPGSPRKLRGSIEVVSVPACGAELGNMKLSTIRTPHDETMPRPPRVIGRFRDPLTTPRGATRAQAAMDQAG